MEGKKPLLVVRGLQGARLRRLPPSNVRTKLHLVKRTMRDFGSREKYCGMVKLLIYMT